MTGKPVRVVSLSTEDAAGLCLGIIKGKAGRPGRLYLAETKPGARHCGTASHKIKAKLTSKDVYLVPSKIHKGQRCAFLEPWLAKAKVADEFTAVFEEEVHSSGGWATKIDEANEAWETLMCHAVPDKFEESLESEPDALAWTLVQEPLAPPGDVALEDPIKIPDLSLRKTPTPWTMARPSTKTGRPCFTPKALSSCSQK